VASTSQAVHCARKCAGQTGKISTIRFKEITSPLKTKAQLQNSRSISQRVATRLENLRIFLKFSISIKKNSAYEYYREIVYLHRYDNPFNDKDTVTSNKSFETTVESESRNA
jgi:hypothetical protein